MKVDKEGFKQVESRSASETYPSPGSVVPDKAGEGNQQNQVHHLTQILAVLVYSCTTVGSDIVVSVKAERCRTALSLQYMFPLSAVSFDKGDTCGPHDGHINPPQSSAKSTAHLLKSHTVRVLFRRHSVPGSQEEHGCVALDFDAELK